MTSISPIFNVLFEKRLNIKIVDMFVFKPMLYALHNYHLKEGAIITREETYIYFCELPEKQLFVFENLVQSSH